MFRVSFVIPTYNNSAWLPHAVESCIAQSHKDIEIVIVDDCSTDTTGQYIDWLLKKGDSRIIYHKNDKNMGRSYSRNLGNKLATGEVICVNDSDDLSMGNRAELTLKKLKTCQVCYGSATLMDALGIRNRDLIAQPLDTKKLLEPVDLKTWMENLPLGRKMDMRENAIVHSTMGYLKEIALKYPYEEGKISDMGIDDWEQQIRMMKDGVKIDYIPEIICAYRSHDKAISLNRDNVKMMELKAEVLNREAVKC